ncbi:hypothetical protein HK102_012289, partial [Quaeritorhiza haematococci]
APVNTVIAIVNPETGHLCAPNETGEIWVSCPANVDAVYVSHNDSISSHTGSTPGDEPTQSASKSYVSWNTGSLSRGGGARGEGGLQTVSRIPGVDPNLVFARTRDIGFLYPVSLEGSTDSGAVTSPAGSRSSMIRTPTATIPTTNGMVASPTTGSFVDDKNGSMARRREGGWNGLVFKGKPYEMVLFVLGRMEEAFRVNGLMYFAQDVERTVEECHRSVQKDGW